MHFASVDELYLCALNLTFVSWKDNPEEVKYFSVLERDIELSIFLWPIKAVLCFLGAFVSSVNVIVLTRRDMRKSSLNVLLVSLESSNVILSILCGIYFTGQIFVGNYAPNNAVVILETFVIVTGTGCVHFANWMTAIIAVWRFIGLNWALKSKRYLSRKRAAVIITSLSLISVIPVVAFYSLYRIKTSDLKICTDLETKNTTMYKYHYLEMSEWAIYHPKTENVIDHAFKVFYFALPIVCLCVATGCLLSSLKKYRKRQANLREGQGLIYIKTGQTRATIVLITLLGLYLCGNSVEIALGVLNGLEKIKSDVAISEGSFILLGYFLTNIINLFSFFAYYFMGSNFRNTFLELCQRKEK